MEKDGVTILVDGREFHHEKRTGISRVLEGIVRNISHGPFGANIRLAVFADTTIPESLADQNNLSLEIIATTAPGAERALSNMTQEKCDLFLSPYPKLPLFGGNCKYVNIIHDVLYITHVGKKGLKTYWDILRLRAALKKADLTWYDSRFSLNETIRLFGWAGRNPRVRYPGIDQRFASPEIDTRTIAENYDLKPGYILTVGNGKAHKNLKVIIDIAAEVRRSIVFVGVNAADRQQWLHQPNGQKCRWIQSVKDADLPALIKNAFCLVQPSFIEGYGYPPLEAMACGVPVIVSDIPVLLETTGARALHVDPNNSAAWKGAIERLENKDFYGAQKEKGLQWSQTLLGKKAWQKYTSDIQQLLDQHP